MGNEKLNDSDPFGILWHWLRDGTTGQAATAATSGHWVFLPPLPKGRHEIEFGGTFKEDRFAQDVSYVLHVR